MLIFFAIVLTISCKNKELLPVYEQPTVDELAYLPYEIGDTIIFFHYYEDGYTDSTPRYLIITDTITETNDSTYRLKYKLAGEFTGDISIIKIRDSLDFELDIIENEYFTTQIKTIREHLKTYNTFTGKFDDVYRIDTYDSDSTTHICHKYTAYIAKNVGIICFYFVCNRYDLPN